MASRTRDIANILSKTEVDNSSNFRLTHTGDSEGSGLVIGSSLTAYSDLNSLPTTGLSAGDQAFVTGNQRYYISNGSGWYNAVLLNATPRWQTEPLASAVVADSATPLTVTAKAADSDNSDANLLNQSFASDSGQYLFRSITSDSSVFTFTPFSSDSLSENATAGNLADSNGGSFVYTYKFSDGISFVSKAQTITYTLSNAVQLWRLLITNPPSHASNLFDIQNANGGEGLGADTDLNGAINTDFLSSHTHNTDGSVIAGYDRYGMFKSTGNPLTGADYFDAALGQQNSVSSSTQEFMRASDTSRFYMYTPANSFLAIGFASARDITTMNFLKIRTYQGNNNTRTPVEMKLQYYSGSIGGTYDTNNWVDYATLTNSGQNIGAPYWTNITDGSTIAAS
jgi:hypothetical protein